MFSLLPYNTFGLDVKAASGLMVNCAEDLKSRDLKAPQLILGRGSDVLFTDDFDGQALIAHVRGIEIREENDSYLVRAGAGEILDDFIATLLKQGITGLENLSGIPGTVGAAPIQNIGAYGVEIGDYIDTIEAVNIDTGELVLLSREECRFGYRDSIFKQQPELKLFVLYVNFVFPDQFVPHLSYKGLKEKELRDADAVRREVLALRSRKLPDPRFVGNAGSFFKNPLVSEDKVKALREIYPDMPVFTSGAEGQYKLAAGWLIDQADCRGITHGQAGTWEHQALVLVNRGQARPHEIVSLAKYVAAQVSNKFAIELTPEVRLYGRHGEVKWTDL